MTRSEVFARSVLAGLLAGAIEIAAFRWAVAVPSLELAMTHLLWLAGVGAVVGAAGLAASARHLTSRLWLLMPSLIAVTPLVTRRFGMPALIGLGVIALGWCAAPGRKHHPRESVLIAAAAGSIAATALGAFLSRHYDGRNTAWEPLATVGAIVILAGLAYAVLPLSGWRPVVRNSRRIAAAVMLLLGITAVHGTEIPSTGAPTSAPAHSPPVVLIVLDTVRADHLELYGYHRDTMPSLTRFARRDAVVVDRAIANAPDSLASHASLFTGLFPTAHGAHRPLLDDPDPPRYGYPLRSDVATVAERLRDHGYSTAGISANFGPISTALGFGLDRGFEHYDASPNRACDFVRRSPWSRVGRQITRWSPAEWLPRCPVRYRRADEVTNEALGWLDGASSSGFFLFINYMDAHSPYRPPRTTHGRFGPGSDGRSGGAVTTRPNVGAHPREENRQVEARYDEELLFLDIHLGRLLSRLKEHPSWDDLLLIVTSDHGEALGEHDLYGHTASLYDVMIRVPLILKPGRGMGLGGIPSAGSRWQRPIQLIDIAPLVLQHAGIDAPGLDGRPPDEPAVPLRAWSFPSRVLAARDPRYSRELRSIEIDGWKLIEDQHGRVELYNLSRDPGEQHNLAPTEQARVQLMQARLGPRSTYRHEAVGEEDELSPEALERLRSLGYIR